jgi:phage terminase small subunit
MDMNKKLTPKQKRFVEEYLIDLNATRAAKAAGYSEKTAKAIGTENLSKPTIMQAITKGMKRTTAKAEISAEYVLSTIRETVERCKQSTPVVDKNGDPVMVKTADGEIVPAYKFEHTGVMKGCELLGRHLKLFTDKIEHDHKISHEESLDELE